MRRKRTRTERFRRIAVRAVCLALVACAVWQRALLASLLANIRRAWRAPDVSSALHVLRRETFGILCVKTETEADDCYVFDRDGVVFGSARTVVGDSIVRVDDASSFRPVLGEAFADPETWKNIMPIVQAARSGDFAASAIAFKRQERELAVTMRSSGTMAYFSAEFSPEKHLRALTELAKKVRIEKLEYVDLRVEGKIFYK